MLQPIEETVRFVAEPNLMAAVVRPGNHQGHRGLLKSVGPGHLWSRSGQLCPSSGTNKGGCRTWSYHLVGEPPL